MRLNRREALVAGLATVSVPARSEPLRASDDDDDLFWDDAEPASDQSVVQARALTDWPRWRDQHPRPTASWAKGIMNVDAGYLSDHAPADEFRISNDLLRSVVEALRYPQSDFNGKVIIGIRGAVPVSAKETRSYQSSVVLARSSPNHVTPKCTMAIWDITSRTVWTTEASTVCNIDYLFAQSIAKNRDTLCNLLPTGLYTYKVGTHRNGTHSPQPGALRLASPVNALRCYGPKLQFDRSGIWQYRGPEISDNIHSASHFSASLPSFSSAGCQVIPGGYDVTHTVPLGEWSQFRVALGLPKKPNVVRKPQSNWMATPEDGQRFTYWLVSGEELSVLGSRASLAGSILKRGSNAGIVEQLQRALFRRTRSRDKVGYFGADTQRQLIALQKAKLGWADGILTPARSDVLGIDLDWKSA